MSRITSAQEGLIVYGVEIEPLQEFTQENLRLKRNYKIFPSVLGSNCGAVYMHTKAHVDNAYKVGQLVAVFGSKVELPALGDLGMTQVIGSTGSMMRPLHESCTVNDLVTVPWAESASAPRCKPEAFQVRQGFLALPTASGTEIDHWLLWLSDYSELIAYKTIVKKYADPDRVNTYLERRYGDILEADCGALPDIMKNSGASGTLYDHRYQSLMLEHCIGQKSSN